MDDQAKKLSRAVLALGALVGVAQAASGAEIASIPGALQLNFSAIEHNERPRIAVKGTGDRFLDINQSAAELSLQLSGTVSDADQRVRIVASEIRFKNEPDAVTALGDRGTAPTRLMATSETFNVPLSATGPIAKAAVDVCNAQPKAGTQAAKHRPSITAPLIWRVTTGRFNFKWTAYDIVAPSQEIYNDASFYGDRESHEAEIITSFEVDCMPLGKATAAKTTELSQRPAASLVTSKSPLKSSLVEPANGVVCDGGMVRQVTGGEGACLCPGNTRRIETSAQAFRCERRTKRL